MGPVFWAGLLLSARWPIPAHHARFKIQPLSGCVIGSELLARRRLCEGTYVDRLALGLLRVSHVMFAYHARINIWPPLLAVDVNTFIIAPLRAGAEGGPAIFLGPLGVC